MSLIHPHKNGKSQKDDVVEVYCAWTPLTDDYSASRERAMSLLAARKATRDFLPAQGEWGLPKSSLDGQRETVLKDFNNTKKKPSPNLRLSGAEQLDCVGVVKRFCSEENRFPSITTVAASSWLGKVKDLDPDKWNELAGLHKDLKTLGAISGTPIELSQALGGWEYEASPLYVNRHKAIAKDASDPDKASAILEKIAGLVRTLSKDPKVGAPEAYYAMILADGDRMGEILGELKTSEAHRHFSQALAGFASCIPKTLQEIGCVCVYSGGDDVLALAPLDKAMEASRTLANTFKTTMAQVEGISNPPTLSVGVVLVHVLEPLGTVRDLARAAEALAKQGKIAPDGALPKGQTKRNALAIQLHTRGSDTACVRGNWDQNIDASIARWVGLFKSGELPSGLPYATRRELDDLRGWTDARALAQAIPLRLARTWKHKEVKVDAPADITTVEQLDQLLEELRVARFFALGEEAR